MIRFTLFGIPVVVEPWFWLSGFILGGGLHFSGSRDLINAGVWMIILFVSILVHELGHALSGRRLGGGRQWIRLWAFGGLAYNDGGRFTRKGRIAMILWGPGAGLLLFLLTVVATFIIYPGMTGVHILDFFIRGKFHTPVNAEAYELLEGLIHRGNPTLQIINSLIWINLWWSLVNLLPVYPLDGGQIAAEVLTPRKFVHQIGLVTAVGFALVGLLVLKRPFIGILFGFLAWQNFEHMKRSGY